MWFLGYNLDERTPDHSVLSKARRRFGVTVYQAFFVEIVRQCERAGLIVGQRLYLDNTLVAANASRDSTRSRAVLAQLNNVEAPIAAVWRDDPNAEAGELPGDAYAPLAGPHAVGPDDPPWAPPEGHRP
jgi:hypothetical protein